MKSPDMVRVSAKSSKVLFKNAQIRVVQVSLRPGQKIPMHSHASIAAWLTLTPAEIRETLQTGKSKVHKLRPGQALWHGPRAHSIENVGKTQYRSLAIDLKIKTLRELGR